VIDAFHIFLTRIIAQKIYTFAGIKYFILNIIWKDSLDESISSFLLLILVFSVAYYDMVVMLDSLMDGDAELSVFVKTAVDASKGMYENAAESRTSSSFNRAAPAIFSRKVGVIYMEERWIPCLAQSMSVHCGLATVGAKG